MLFFSPLPRPPVHSLSVEMIISSRCIYVSFTYANRGTGGRSTNQLKAKNMTTHARPFQSRALVTRGGGDQWRYVGGCGEEVDARIRGMRLITCRLDPGQLTSPVYMYNNKIQSCPSEPTRQNIPHDIIRGFIGPTITFPYRLIVGRAGGFM